MQFLNSIKIKILALVSVVLFIALVFPVPILLFHLNNLHEQNLNDSFVRKGREINQLIQSNLLLEAKLLGSHKSLATLIKTKDRRNIAKSVKGYLEEFKLSIISVYDQNAEYIYGPKRFILKDLREQSRALITKAKREKTATGLTMWEGKLALLIAAPIGSSPEPGGWIVVGRFIDSNFVKQINRDSRADVSFLVKNKVFGSSMDPEAQEGLVNKMLELSKDPRKFRRGTAHDGNGNVLSFKPIRDIYGNRIAMMVIQLSVKGAEAIRRQMFGKIIMLSLVTVIVSFCIAIIVSRAITRPLLHLKNVTDNMVKTKDFTKKVDIAGKDEAGALGRSFNELTATLESTMVSKYYVDNVIKSIGDILIVLDRSGRIQVVNQPALDKIGYTQEELTNQDVMMLFGDPDGYSTDGLVHAYLDQLLKKETIKELEVNIRTKKGELISAHLSGTLMKDEKGDVKGMVLFAKDIRESLLVQELKNTQQQLVQSGKLAALGELSAGVAHEINQPLFLIQGFTNRIRSAFKKHDAVKYEQVKDHIHDVNENVKRMKKIVQHFREFSRQSDNKRRPVQINEVIQKSFSLFNEQLRLRNILIEERLAEQNPVVIGDPTRLEQVFVNLISNSRDALEAVTKHKQALLTVTSKVSNGCVIVEFSDNGTGVDADVINRIFDPFFTTKEVGKGTGLGLSISHGIIREHKGDIWCESSFGQGAIFRIQLPLYDSRGRFLVQANKLCKSQHSH